MSGKGSAFLRRYQEGKRLTLGQSVLAKCAECCCDYLDGRLDCGVESCPLQPFMPYAGSFPAPPSDEPNGTGEVGMVPKKARTRAPRPKEAKRKLRV